MPKPVIDLTGKTFGKWTVTGEAGRRPYNGETAWRCKCTCGRYGIVASADLRLGKSRGCLRCSYPRRRKQNEQNPDPSIEP